MVVCFTSLLCQREHRAHVQAIHAAAVSQTNVGQAVLGSVAKQQLAHALNLGGGGLIVLSKPVRPFQIFKYD